ncbi:MAG: hypothetical protein WC792_05145 [Candidatus Micrarchaeia archaeon]|jgi:hypothetical protein
MVVEAVARLREKLDAAKRTILLDSPFHGFETSIATKVRGKLKRATVRLFFPYAGRPGREVAEKKYFHSVVMSAVNAALKESGKGISASVSGRGPEKRITFTARE